MKKNFKMLLVVLLIVVNVVGCSQKGALKNDSGKEPVGKKESITDDKNAEQKGTITIVDHTGGEIVIPSKIERVVIDQVPLAATYVMFNKGKCDRLVGMSESVMQSIKGTELVNIAPEILEVSTKHNRGELNIEEMLKLKPDVVLYNAGNEEHRELFKKVGVPAVGFSTSGDPTKLYSEWLKLLEKTFQEEGKMNDVINYGQNMIDRVKERTSKIDEKDKKNALILFNISDNGLRVSGANKHFGHFWLENINVKNAAGSVEGIKEVNMEQLYVWDPDIIFIPGPGQSKVTSKDVINNEVKNYDFSSLKAVQNGEVFSSKLGMWSWYTPNPDAPLVLTWLAKEAYPDLFKDINLEAETKTYYKNFYGYDLDKETIEDIFKGR